VTPLWLSGKSQSFLRFCDVGHSWASDSEARLRDEQAMTQRQYIVEFVPSGRYVKVSAIDPETGIEVSIVGDASASEEMLKATAVRKLEYVMAKKAGGRKGPAAPPPGRGKLV
jgi:hypothetical protein